MKIEFSGTGALTGGAVGALARAGVSYFYFGDFLQRHANDVPNVILISFAIGFVVGILSGAAGRPLIGTIVGGVLGATAYFLTMLPLGFCFCVASFNQEPLIKVEDLLIPMGLAGALAGAAGGTAGLVRRKWKREHESKDRPDTSSAEAPPPFPPE
jgi:hypothetical protein